MIRKKNRGERIMRQQEAIDKITEVFEAQADNMAKKIAQVLAETIDRDSEVGRLLVQHTDADGKFEITVNGQQSTLSSANDPTNYKIFINQSVSLKGTDAELFPFSLQVHLFPYADDFYYFGNQIDQMNDLFERVEQQIMDKHEVDDIEELAGSADYEVFDELRSRLGFSLALYDKIQDADEEYYEDDPEYQKYLEDVESEMSLMDGIKEELEALL